MLGGGIEKLEGLENTEGGANADGRPKANEDVDWGGLKELGNACPLVLPMLAKVEGNMLE